MFILKIYFFRYLIRFPKTVVPIIRPITIPIASIDGSLVVVVGKVFVGGAVNSGVEIGVLVGIEGLGVATEIGLDGVGLGTLGVAFGEPIGVATGLGVDTEGKGVGGFAQWSSLPLGLPGG